MAFIWFDVGATQQYYPLTHSAFWFMHQLWGHTTIGYHLINIVLHATSAWLLTIILRRLAVPGAFLAAVIFALHPVAVESVAWMTELKNTLSGVCYLAAALAYLRFDARREGRAYAASFVSFVLALLAKTVTAVLPAALLVVFWWKRGSIDGRRDVRPLVPFFVIGGAVGVVTAWFERTLNGARIRIPGISNRANADCGTGDLLLSCQADLAGLIDVHLSAMEHRRGRLATLRLSRHCARGHRGVLGSASPVACAARRSVALEAFRDAVRYAPTSAEMHFALASALASTGRFDDAAVEFKEALRLRPDYQEAKTSLESVRQLQARQAVKK